MIFFIMCAYMIISSVVVLILDKPGGIFREEAGLMAASWPLWLMVAITFKIGMLFRRKDE